jgi:hypothetical protein
MNTRITRCATGALFLFALILPGLSGCGGGGSAARIVFTLQSVNPDTSPDLNGGDRVTITGANFSRFVGFTIRFGAGIGVNPLVESDTAITVTTPGQSGPGSVIVEVTAVNEDGELVVRQLFDAYTYVGSSSNPNPQTITPTTFTATGAESFTIGGTDLGSPGGTVSVNFAGIGSVTGTVSNDATLVVGNAPISSLTAPVSPVTVTVGGAAVPTQVAYTYAGPQSLLVRFQNAGGASRPVRITDGFAAMCTAGGDNAWQTADDEVYILQMGPGGAPLFVPVRRPNTTPVGWLNRFDSIPVALDANTICVYSVGPNGGPDAPGAPTPDDRIVQITTIQTAPTVTDHPAPWPNTAPIARISSTAVAFTGAGPNQIRGDLDDVLWVYQFTGTTLGLARSWTIGAVDVTTGSGNISIPFSADGDVVHVLVPGPNGTLLDGDDLLWRATVSSNTLLGPVTMPWLTGVPKAVAGNLAVSASFGPNGAPGGGDDRVLVASTNAGPFGVAAFNLGQWIDGAALALSAPFGGAKLAVPTIGPDNLPGSGDERILLYTDLTTGALTSLPVPGTSTLATLGSGDLVVFGPGVNLFQGDGDDTATRVDGSGVTAQGFLSVPTWGGGLVPLTDQSRTFAIGDPDGAPMSGDETLLIHQSASLGNAVDAATLPLASVGAPATLAQPFVPVGPDWGVIQSPGPDRTYQTNDDRIIFARY